jgi:hypothetical protein
VPRALNDPAARLFQAVQRYTDALHVAAEQVLGPHTIAQLDQADQYIPGLTDEPAWRAVWRAAYGINPQDPRPTGGTQLETLSALWKQRLDRHIAHSTDSSDNARADELQAAHTERRRWHDHSQRPHQQPERRPSGPSARGR